MTDYFVDGETARLVRPGSAEDMAVAILDLLDDPAAARQMGAAGRERVLDQHTTQTMCAALYAITTSA